MFRGKFYPSEKKLYTDDIRDKFHVWCWPSCHIKDSGDILCRQLAVNPELLPYSNGNRQLLMDQNCTLLCFKQCALYPVQCYRYIILSAVFIVHCTLYLVQNLLTKQRIATWAND